jgi:hypothetical protein
VTASQVAVTGRPAAAAGPGGYPRRWLAAIVMIVGALMDMTAEIAYQPMSARVSAETACEIWHKA